MDDYKGPYDTTVIQTVTAFQQDGWFHPLTCGGDRSNAAHKEFARFHDERDHGLLRCDDRGLYCPVPGCGYRQEAIPAPWWEMANQPEPPWYKRMKASKLTGQAHVSGLVRSGTSAHFQLANRNWHRTESYPSPCLCGFLPSVALTVKPGWDDAWKLSPDDTWGDCIGKLADRGDRGRDYAMVPDVFGATFEVGSFVRIIDKAAHNYEHGKSHKWVIEQLGLREDDHTVRVARIRNEETGVWCRVPLTWIEPWTEPKKEEPMVDMSTKADPMTVKFALEPTDDAKISCIVCHGEHCEYEFSARAVGRRSAHGIHGACARGIIGVEVS